MQLVHAKIVAASEDYRPANGSFDSWFGRGGFGRNWHATYHQPNGPTCGRSKLVWTCSYYWHKQIIHTKKHETFLRKDPNKSQIKIQNYKTMISQISKHQKNIIQHHCVTSFKKALIQPCTRGLTSCASNLITYPARAVPTKSDLWRATWRLLSEAGYWTQPFLREKVRENNEACAMLTAFAESPPRKPHRGIQEADFQDFMDLGSTCFLAFPYSHTFVRSVSCNHYKNSTFM